MTEPEYQELEILPPAGDQQVPADITSALHDAPASGSAQPFGGAARAQGEPEVGFAARAAMTSAMLARYLVGRAIAARVSVSLMLCGLVILAGAAALWVWGPTWVAVIVGLIGLAVLAFRALLMAILRRLMAVGRFGAAEEKIRSLVGDTGSDLRRELRRIGLPGTVFGLPILAWRLIGKRRRETLTKFADFDVARVVPRSRLDELDFVVRNDIFGTDRR
jgi:hypothetical protein